MIRAFAAAILLLFATDPSSRDVERAADALKPFKETLQKELRAGMAKSPVEAIEVCRVRAPEIARELSTECLRMGRTSHKLRNAENAPPPWVEPTLVKWLDDPGSRRPTVIELQGGAKGYIEPIVAAPLCLVCHGTKVAEPVRAKLAELYPEDEATGFENGDLRGAFWVEMKDLSICRSGE